MNTTKVEGGEPVAGPVERPVRALDPEREEFEAWCHRRWGADAYRHTSATCGEWDAWQAARPKRAAVGAIVNVAADLAQRKPLRAMEPLTEVSHIGHRQMARAYAKADEDTRLLAVKLAEAVRAL